MPSIQHQAARQAENFPVASWLLPAHARKGLLACYDFLRGADDISDNPALPVHKRQEQMLALIDDLEHGAPLPRWAEAYARLAASDSVVAAQGQKLLQAFLQDTQKDRYATLAELSSYCDLSAAPVGRLVLHLCREDKALLPAADALCHALQLLNHLQDIRSDYVTLNRIYLPQSWLAEFAVPEAALAATASSAGLRQTIDRLLDHCEYLLLQARALPHSVCSLRTRIELRWIGLLAKQLCTQLRKRDPLAGRVRISNVWALLCLLKACFGGTP